MSDQEPTHIGHNAQFHLSITPVSFKGGQVYLARPGGQVYLARSGGQMNLARPGGQMYLARPGGFISRHVISVTPHRHGTQLSSLLHHVCTSADKGLHMQRPYSGLHMHMYAAAIQGAAYVRQHKTT